jgi:hypothetical protein
LPTFWADNVAYASANNDSPSPPTADVSDESLPTRSDHPATSLRNPEHVDQPSEQGSTDHPAIPETSLRSPEHVEQPSEQGSTAEGDNSLSPPVQTSRLFTAYLHAIGPQESDETVGKLGNSASPADSFHPGLGIKQLAPGISPVVE